MKPRLFGGELIFTLCIASYIVILVVLSFGYTPESRLFPRLVLVPTILFLVLRLISMINPKLSRILEPESGVIDTDTVQRLAKVTRELDSKEKDNREFKVISWIIGLVILVYLFGILPATALFVFLFVKIYGARNFLTSAAFTIATWIFVYFIFVMVLQVRLYTGVLKIAFLD